MRRQKGFALVMVMAVIALVTAAAVELTREAQTAAALAANFQDRTRARLKALDGVDAAVRRLLLDENGYDYSGDDWAEPLGGVGAGFEAAVTDLSGRINLNRLMNENGEVRQDWVDIMARLFYLLDADPDLVQALLDWLDPDNLVRTGGAEKDDYRAAERDYEPRNGPLLSAAEAGRVLGFDEELMNGHDEKPGLKELVDIHGGDKVNINTAPPYVLMALDEDMDEEAVDRIELLREAGGVRQLSELAPVLGQELYQKVSKFLTTSSSHFAVQSIGFSGRARYPLRVVVHREQGRVTVTEAEVIR